MVDYLREKRKYSDLEVEAHDQEALKQKFEKKNHNNDYGYLK